MNEKSEGQRLLTEKFLATSGVGTAMQDIVGLAISRKSATRGLLKRQTTSAKLSTELKYLLEANSVDLPYLNLKTREISSRAEGWYSSAADCWMILALGHLTDAGLIKLNASHGPEGFDAIADRRNLLNYNEVSEAEYPHAIGLIVSPDSTPRAPKAWLCDILGFVDHDNQYLRVARAVPYQDWNSVPGSSPRVVTIDF